MHLSLKLLILICITTASACGQREPNYDERLYIWAAVASQSIEPCKKIGASSIDTWSFNSSGFQADSLRSECFRSVAIKTNDKKLCKYVQPVSRLKSWWLDGTGYSTEYCLQEVAKNTRFVLNTLIPEQQSRLLMSLKYSNELMYDICDNHFSIQRENNNNLKNIFLDSYDTCITREMRTGGGLDRHRGTTILSDKRKNACHQRALMHSGVKEYYFGDLIDKRFYDRRYGYCEHYCSINKLDGYCKKTDEKIPDKLYKNFLESQARYGDLLQRLKQMPDY